ncbi:uncharacterized protein [Montipora capricornis]|uniref:uncharacterized protein isoform X2 n=1 Tax=Montipora capricornis TaxID=246305 RepID=UPI0035F219C4
MKRKTNRDLHTPFFPHFEHVLFYRYFTPIKLESAATFIHHHHWVTPQELTFLGAPRLHRLLNVPLIPPKTVSPNAELVIKMLVGLETKYGQVDSDPSFVVSDGNQFVGALTRDKKDYGSAAPCQGIEGVTGPTMTNRRSYANLPKASQSYYPGRIEINLSLLDRWGSCFVPLDGGFSREMVYQNKLNPQKGLFLEIYGDDANEKQGVKYIEVTIMQEK